MALRLLPSFFFFSSFILLLLVALSVPIIKQIFLLTATVNVTGSVLGTTGSAAESVDFGVWGWCAGDATLTVAGQTDELVAPQCSSPQLGYVLDPTVSGILELSGTSAQDSQLLQKGVTVALILHPIAAALALLTCLFSFLLLRPYASWCDLCGLLPVALLSTATTTVIFVVDLVFVIIARSKVSDATGGAVALGFGNGVWMVLGAMVAVWLGLFGVFGAVCCGGTDREEGGWREEPEYKW
ncbi:hypothetical protein DACRYDRAFT_19897 [Dacryopinax primogenitus]|uniref:Pali-domain-containing protein n=1 Tax=Dacryopinax primogenitus (strain DJM 731) TaxID=1858805 RepID=M5GGF0_DACPD|nr:uncharacterized protein DACRYDRAFT_19897 [Dacryopinax primogenitus]EJU05373.1 hypothetical protein DACRYDRAFT_19897 [Dacryopinax primogenitus]